jgi:hypothetical protein
LNPPGIFPDRSDVLRMEQDIQYVFQAGAQSADLAG